MAMEDTERRCDGCGTTFPANSLIHHATFHQCSFCMVRVALRVMRESGIGAKETQMTIRSLFKETWHLDWETLNAP